jgi:maleate cis-trans isomerase
VKQVRVPSALRRVLLTKLWNTLSGLSSQSHDAGRVTAKGRNQKGVAYFKGHGFEIVHVSHLMPPIEVPHPNTGSAASPAEIYEWVRSHVPSSAQAVFIGGNALRAIGVIAALEEDLGRPILTANQVSLWYALRRAGAEARVDDYGQVFTRPISKE